MSDGRAKRWSTAMYRETNNDTEYREWGQLAQVQGSAEIAESHVQPHNNPARRITAALETVKSLWRKNRPLRLPALNRRTAIGAAVAVALVIGVAAGVDWGVSGRH